MSATELQALACQENDARVLGRLLLLVMALDTVTRPIHPKADPAANEAFGNFTVMIDEIQGKHPKATALEV